MKGIAEMIDGLQFVIRHVEDVAAVRAFYTEKLGFAVVIDQSDFVQFAAPNGAILGVARDTGNPEDLPIELWWVVDDADAVHAELQAKGVEIAIPLRDEPFGRTFAVKDATGGYSHMLQLPR